MPDATETIVVVHGTFAAPQNGVVKWWQPGGSFCVMLDENLSEKGSQARCWQHLSRLEDAFHWSGQNSEVARQEAGEHLAEYLERLENDAGVTRYHLIAHSHGGNILINALRSPRLNVHDKLGMTFFLGTPFFQSRADVFVRNAGRLLELIIFLPCLLIWALIILAVGNEGRLQDSPLAVSFGGGFLVSMIFAGITLYIVTTHSHIRGLTKERGYRFMFSCDEAFQLLRRAARIRRRPRKYFLSLDRLPRFQPYLSRHIPKFRSRVLFPLLKMRKALRNWRALVSWRAKLAAFGEALLGIAFWSFYIAMLAPVYLTLAAALLLTDYVLGVFSWIINAARARVLRRGLQSVADLCLGNDLLFDINVIVGQRPASLHLSKVRIPDEVELRLRENASKDAKSIIDAAYGLGGMDFMTNFEEVLADPKLVHNQYYCEAYVVESIADLIADFRPSSEDPAPPASRRLFY